MKKILFILILLGAGYWAITYYNIKTLDDAKALIPGANDGAIEDLIELHAQTWEEYNEDLFLSTISKDIVFAYPGRRLDYNLLFDDYRAFHETFKDTKVHINKIIIDGEDVAVEWQFATTQKDTGKRTVVSDGIIGKVVDGKITVWKEYLDGRVSRMQNVDALPLEEGEEPFPSPNGSLRNYCEVACTP